jgi:hypothetical protein
MEKFSGSTSQTRSGGGDNDAGTLLWSMIKKELEHDESGFKHRVFVLDNVIKGCMFFLTWKVFVTR